jgi:hypothetical protein
MPNIMLEFLNTFVMKVTYIYFGYQDKVYVISKHLIVDVFGVYAERYVEDPKGQVGKTITLQALQSCKIAPINFVGNQWNAKNLGLPYFVRYPAIISVIYQREKMTYFNNKNVITLMRIVKGKKVDWAQIIYNSLCSELDQWYKYVKDNEGDKRAPINQP